MDVVLMPQLGETVVEGTITAWAKAVGDAVAVDDTLFEVSTEKVDTEVPSAVAGFLRMVLVDEGDSAPIGTPVAVITETVDEPFDLPDASAAPAPDPPPSASNRRRFDAHGPGEGERAVVSPVVRRLLEEHDLELDHVVGSGRDGRVTRADVLAAAAQASNPSKASKASNPIPANQLEPGEGDQVVPLSRARLATAEHLHRSVATAAHALVVVEVDWTAVDRARSGRRLSYLPFAARAVVDALVRFPHLNASFDGDRLLVHRGIHLGIAVDVDQEALLVPVVRDAQDLRLPALSEAISQQADLARRHRLPGDAFDGGTFTLTNVGSYGTVLAAPIINQPQVAILSTDGVRMRPTAVADDAGGWSVGIRPLGNLSLSFDHRAVDGAYAAAFLGDVRDQLQDRDWTEEVDG